MTNEWTDLPTLQDVAKAQADGWEIEIHIEGYWYLWDASYWKSQFKYRARPRQPQMKKVKMLCWYGLSDSNDLNWVNEGESWPINRHWIRIPAQDIEIEISDGV